MFKSYANERPGRTSSTKYWKFARVLRLYFGRMHIAQKKYDRPRKQGQVQQISDTEPLAS